MRSLVFAAALLSACVDSGTASVRLDLDVRVRTDNGDVVADAIVAVDATTRGPSDENGSLQTTAVGVPGQRVHVDVTCPSGYRRRPNGLDVVLRRADDANDANDAGVNALVVDVECLPAMRRGVLVARATGASWLPILMNGEPSGALDAAGLAHLPLSLLPGTSLRVTIDTSSAPALRPANPTQHFAIEDRDAVLVFDQAFVAAVPQRVSRRRRQLPYRID